jgi:hypothetical protein
MRTHTQTPLCARCNASGRHLHGHARLTTPLCARCNASGRHLHGHARLTTPLCTRCNTSGCHLHDHARLTTPLCARCNTSGWHLHGHARLTVGTTCELASRTRARRRWSSRGLTSRFFLCRSTSRIPSGTTDLKLTLMVRLSADASTRACGRVVIGGICVCDCDCVCLLWFALGKIMRGRGTT